MESGQDEMETGVADGSLDIALLSEPERRTIDFIPLLDDPMLVVFSGKHPGDYDSRMLEPESYRTLGIGIKSIKEAGPLARSVISYLKENVR